jgi:hypothetical protein
LFDHGSASFLNSKDAGHDETCPDPGLEGLSGVIEQKGTYGLTRGGALARFFAVFVDNGGSMSATDRRSSASDRCQRNSMLFPVDPPSNSSWRHSNDSSNSTQVMFVSLSACLAHS